MAGLLIANAALLLALVWVMGEQASRAAYAAQEGLSLIVSRSLFTYTTTLAGRNGQLTSPPTLDWVQVIILGLGLFDLYYVYKSLKSRKTAA